MPRPKGVKNVNPPHVYTDEELDWLRVNYRIYSVNELLPRFNEHFNLNITKDQLKNTLNRKKILSGRTGQWQKGHAAYNKGKTWDEYMSPEGQANSRKTWFNSTRTMNNADWNKVPVGTEHEYDGYVYVRQNVRNEKTKAYRWWKLKHHIIWEEANGPIPEGHSIIFADGDTHNFDLDNLICVSRGELAILNKNNLIYKGNADATKCGVTLSKIMIRRKQRAKK
jgi:hypothetical protein